MDLKTVNFLLRHLGGCTKYPCFLCLSDRHAKDTLDTKKWLESKTLQIGGENTHEPLVPRNKIIFPPLIIMLGLMDLR